MTDTAIPTATDESADDAPELLAELERVRMARAHLSYTLDRTSAPVTVHRIPVRDHDALVLGAPDEVSARLALCNAHVPVGASTFAAPTNDMSANDVAHCSICQERAEPWRAPEVHPRDPIWIQSTGLSYDGDICYHRAESVGAGATLCGTPDEQLWNVSRFARRPGMSHADNTCVLCDIAARSALVDIVRGEYVPPAPAIDPATVPVALSSVESLPLGDEHSASAARGRAALHAFRYERHGSTIWHSVSVSDLLAYIHERYQSWSDDVLMVTRTLRAAARVHRWTDDYDATMYDMLTGGELEHGAWRGWHSVPDALPMSGELYERDAVDIGAPTRGLRTSALPENPRHLPYGTTALDLLTLARSVEDAHVSDIGNIAQRLYEMANGEHNVSASWCNEYEETCERMNRELSADAGEPFQSREQEYVVTFVVTETRYITVPVMARDEDDAADMARDNMWDHDGYDHSDTDVELESVEMA